MTSEDVSHSLDVDQAELTGLLRTALESPALQVLSWAVQPLHGGVERGSVVYRLQGQAGAQGGTVPWSLILKVVQPLPGEMDPLGKQYYKREALAFQSGLLNRLPGKIRAPYCYAVQERPDGSIRLWLEDVRDEVGKTWPLAQYGVAARLLGQWNGAYLVGEPLPSESWITRDWLRRNVEFAAPMIDFIRHNCDHPIVRSLCPGNFLAQMLALWDERGRMFDVLDRLPQVFCHQDAFRRNLFVRSDGMVIIDWGYAGIAPVGAELASLVMATASFLEVPPSRVGELDQVCFEGYMHGLRDAGWEGPARLVRLGQTVYTLLRFVIGSIVGEVLPIMLDDDMRSHIDLLMGRPAEELERTYPALVAHYERLIMEAFRLLGVGSLLRFAGGTTRYVVALRRRKG